MIFTVGHSTLELARFVALLRDARIEAIADVRRHPGSRRLPWFNEEALAHGLAVAGIGYSHIPELGGRRTRAPDSPNGGWENAAFQGYADWMGTAEFAAGLHRLERTANARPTAIMCAEAQWWRCHRRLLADALLTRGWRVRHLMPDGRTADHALTSFAVVVDGRLSYPPQQLSLS